MSTRIRAGCLGVLLLAPCPARAQGGNPAGTEFRVNTFTTGDQYNPAVEVDASGNFVVAWHSPQDGDGFGISGQRFAASGVPLGAEFRINSFTTGLQGLAAVAADTTGSFVVTWTSLGQDGSGAGVFGQRYAGAGAPLGTEFRVNTYTTNFQGYASLSSDPAGSFVVVWESVDQDGSGYGVFGQRYAGGGAPQGLEFRVNTYTTGPQGSPSVAHLGTGGFVVVWNSTHEGSAEGIFGQRYDATGAPLGQEFRVNAYTTGGQFRAEVSSDLAGGFVVVWTSQLQDGSGDGIFGQRFAGTGAPAGAEFRVNTFTTNPQFLPGLATDASGNFVVTWDSVAQDGSTNGIFGQRFTSGGPTLGPEFRVNTYTTSAQFRAAVAANALGSFVVVWTSDGPDGDGYGIFGQRYDQIVPVELMRFGVE